MPFERLLLFALALEPKPFAAHGGGVALMPVRPRARDSAKVPA